MKYKAKYSKSGNIPIVILFGEHECGHDLENKLFAKFDEMGLVILETSNNSKNREKFSKINNYNLDEIKSLLFLLKKTSGADKILILGIKLANAMAFCDIEISTDPKLKNSSLAVISNNIFSDMGNYKTNLQPLNWNNTIVKKFHDENEGVIGLQFNISRSLLGETKLVNENSETSFQEIFRFVIYALAGLLSPIF